MNWDDGSPDNLASFQLAWQQAAGTRSTIWPWPRPRTLCGSWLLNVDQVVAGEVEQEIELRGQHSGSHLAFDIQDMQLPVVDPEDVSDGQFSGGDLHDGLPDYCVVSSHCLAYGRRSAQGWPRAGPRGNPGLTTSTSRAPTRCGRPPGARYSEWTMAGPLTSPTTGIGRSIRRCDIFRLRLGPCPMRAA